MKSLSVKAVLVLLIIFFSFLAPVPAICDQYLDDIQSKIKNLEKDESDHESAINYWKDSNEMLQNGTYVFVTVGPKGTVGVPIPKSLFEEWVIMGVVNGKLTPREAADWAKDVGRLTRVAKVEAPGEISRLEREQEKIKDELLSLRSEQARLRESRAHGNQFGGDGSRALANQPRGGDVMSGPSGTYQTLHTHVGCTTPNSDCNNNKPYNISCTFVKMDDGKIKVDTGNITLVGDLNGTDYKFTYNGYGWGSFQFSPDFSSFTGTFEDKNGHRGTWTGNKLKE